MSPCPWYFFATETTKRRLARTSLWRASGLALLDALGEVHFLLRLQQGDLPDLLEVLVQHALLAGDVHRATG